MSRNLDTTFEGLFNEIKGKKNKAEKTEIEKKENTKLSESTNINSDDDWFSNAGVSTPGNTTIKIKPQNETEFAHINARDFYFRQLRNVSDIKNNDFSQQVKVNGIDPSLSLRISLAELNCIITNSQGVSKVMPLSKLYEKVFKGADPAQDLLEFNLEQDKLYKEYCEREGNKAFSQEEKKEYIEDVFGEFDSTPVESSFVKTAKEVLGNDVDVDKDDGATIVSTKGKRGRPKKEENTPKITTEVDTKTGAISVYEEITPFPPTNYNNFDVEIDKNYYNDTTKNLDVVDFENSVVAEGNLVNYKDISSQIPVETQVEKTASLLSNNPTESQTETETISDRDFEGFARVITALARAILSK